MTVCTGKEKMTHSWKLDVESTFGGISLTMLGDKHRIKIKFLHIPNFIAMLIIYLDVTMLTTCTGVGKYKTIQKKGSNVVEWTICFKDCGYVTVSLII